MLIKIIEERRLFKILNKLLKINKFTKRRTMLNSTVKIKTILKCFNFKKTLIIL